MWTNNVSNYFSLLLVMSSFVLPPICPTREQGNNCIGYMNRKFFVLFLYYATICCSMVAVIAPRGILITIDGLLDADPSIAYLVLMFLAYLMCALHAIVLALFAAFHTFLVLKNRTTIEHSSSNDDERHRYDHGALRNWNAVFGSRPALWFVPVGVGRDSDVGRWRSLADDAV